MILLSVALRGTLMRTDDDLVEGQRRRVARAQQRHDSYGERCRAGCVAKL